MLFLEYNVDNAILTRVQLTRGVEPTGYYLRKGMSVLAKELIERFDLEASPPQMTHRRRGGG